MVSSKTIIATPPGQTVKEQLSNRSMTQKEFAKRMDMSEKHISKLINGEVQITPSTAERLEMVLGIPSRFWNNLEAIYREKLIKAENENSLDNDKLLAKKYPYGDISKHNWVPKTNDINERVLYLRQFFEVARLSLISEELLPGIACRRQSESDKADYALITWAQQARKEARNISTKPININKLIKNIDYIRSMTDKKPEWFCGQLRTMLADCGIAMVFLPHIGGSFLHGATFYDGKKIVLGLTVRGKDADKFWFSLFHELAHIIKGHINQNDGTTENDEKDADSFARITLINDADFMSFVENNKYGVKSIKQFAEKIGIDPGIVVGRLQKEGYIKYSNFNGLKTKYTIA